MHPQIDASLGIRLRTTKRCVQILGKYQIFLHLRESWKPQSVSSNMQFGPPSVFTQAYRVHDYSVWDYYHRMSFIHKIMHLNPHPIMNPNSQLYQDSYPSSFNTIPNIKSWCQSYSYTQIVNSKYRNQHRTQGKPANWTSQFMSPGGQHSHQAIHRENLENGF